MLTEVKHDDSSQSQEPSAVFLLVSLATFVLLYLNRPPFVWHSDLASYAFTISSGRSDLIFGRAGFVWLHHWLYQLFSISGPYPFDHYQDVMRTMGAGFSAVSVFLLQRLMFLLTRSATTALCSALIFCSLPYIFLHGPTEGSDTMALTFQLLGIYCFFRYSITKSRTLLFASAFAFGYACCIREQSFMTVLFVAMILRATKQLSPVSRKDFIIATLSFLMTAFVGPIFYLLRYGKIFVNKAAQALRNMGADNDQGLFVSLSEFSAHILNSPTGYVGAVFFAIGLFYLAKKGHLGRWYILLLAGPQALILLLFSSEVVADQRLFGSLFMLHACSSAVAITQILRHKTAALIATVALCLYAIPQVQSKINERDTLARKNQTYYESDLFKCETQCIFFVGYSWPFAFMHRIHRKNMIVILNGWSWRPEFLHKISSKYSDYEVIIDLSAEWLPHERNELENYLKGRGITAAERKIYRFPPALDQ